MKKWMWVALVFIVSCYLPAGVRSCFGQFSSKRVVDRFMVHDPEQLPNRWKRPTDPIIDPMFMLVAYDGSACQVSPSDFVMAKNEEEFMCEWRMPRGDY